jgi:hypothetical protein
MTDKNEKIWQQAKEFEKIADAELEKDSLVIAKKAMVSSMNKFLREAYNRGLLQAAKTSARPTGEERILLNALALVEAIDQEEHKASCLLSLACFDRAKIEAARTETKN